MENKWDLWGPYLSERAWGTVREDYSKNGDAWNFLPFERAKSKAFRWSEDGIGGISDIMQRICLSFSFWNYKDDILKERFFGLTNSEGNHGEDVKEYYYYLDAEPKHSFLKMLYKYPCNKFPYKKLLQENAKRSLKESEYELLDTKIFDKNEYFDIFINYAKKSVDDILIKVDICNRSNKKEKILILPQIWFRNYWSWDKKHLKKPKLKAFSKNCIKIKHPELEEYFLYAQNFEEILFTENETKYPNKKGFFKDAFHEYFIDKNKKAVNSKKVGTKAAFQFSLEIESKKTKSIILRFSKKFQKKPFENFSKIFSQRKKDADKFYKNLQKGILSKDKKNVQRQALSSLIWSKQFYNYNVYKWLKGDDNFPSPDKNRKNIRNSDWEHLNNSQIILMPDAWEYPWYASWDLCFHTIAYSMLDMEFAKKQLLLLTHDWYMHPRGEFPAYEWNFSSTNPPLQGWAALRLFYLDRDKRKDDGDYEFLEKIFHRLILNFTWWVNQVDDNGLNIFKGGFLGLDNIGVFDRNQKLPMGGKIDQSDGTAWVAMLSLNLMRIALELSKHDLAYQDMATKFFEHFLYIAESMTNTYNEGKGLWDEKDNFYYDILKLPNGKKFSMKVRSMVGLIPLLAVETIHSSFLEKVPKFKERMLWFLEKRKDLFSLISHWNIDGMQSRRLLSLVPGERLKLILKRVLDETEFLSDYGIRSLSKIYDKKPFVFSYKKTKVSVKYLPAESDSKIFGGNSNWRGPIWFPLNYLIIEALYKYYHYFGKDFKVEYPTGSKKYLNLKQVAEKLRERLTKIFLNDKNGKRAVFKQYKKMQDDPYFKDNLLFFEYFHGDIGRGVGASHQTGWTALIAKILDNRII